MPEREKNKLLILWTSRDREVALNMVFMYTLNAKMRGWWKNIRFVVWGPSAKLLSEDIELQDHIQKMIEVGIDIMACRACADRYGVSEKLEAMGIDVKYMGEPLTESLKDDYTIITF